MKVSGFNTIRSQHIPGEEKRGGVAALISHSTWPSIMDIDSRKDQLWFRLDYLQDTTIGAVYISPQDSPYFSMQSFADIQEKSVGGNKLLIIGDLNARLGDLTHFDNQVKGLKYSKNPDTQANNHGTHIKNICDNHDIVPVNHAQYKDIHCDGNYTFRKKDKWISQLDWALVSTNILSSITQFAIVENSILRSDHAAIALSLTCESTSLKELLWYSKALGQSVFSESKRNKLKTFKINQIDQLCLMEHLTQNTPGWDSQDIVTESTNALYKACLGSTQAHQRHQTPHTGTCSHSRWKAVLQEKDSKTLWNAIGWKGTWDKPLSKHAMPSDKEFTDHFNKLLNPSQDLEAITITATGIHIPILDEDITPGEVIDAIKKMKPNKAAGVDGIPPGILKWLPDSWILLVTFIMNTVFHGAYPPSWTLSKMFVIYKKGLEADTNNYRGISIANTLPKLYDTILNERFISWYTPCIEQAGAQAGRGCEEQLATLRLLLEYARAKQAVLYMLFVDYMKAYDKVNRNKLISMLNNQGCGTQFIKAVGCSMRDTINVIGSEKFQSTAGVKQGSSMSCALFTFYLDHTIKAVRSFGLDGFLEDIHMLLFMDDTVLLATSRDAMEKKLKLLHDSAKEIDMVIHPDKSQFLVINSQDRNPFRIEDIVISHTDTYCYLGSPISTTQIGNHVEAHMKAKYYHIIKYYSFINKNLYAPYKVKEKVLQAALSSALLYGCESWFTTQLNCVDTAIRGCTKALLGVRDQSTNDLVYMETGTAPISSEVRRRQAKFIKKMQARQNFGDSPLGKAVHMTSQTTNQAGKYIKKLLNQDPIFVNPVESEKEKIRLRIEGASTTRLVTYKSINRNLSIHPIYTDSDIPEPARIAFSRIRLSSHYLRIETGRWSRIPRENRTCICGNYIQTEEHVLLHCIITQPLRDTYRFLDFTDMNTLMDSTDYNSLAVFCQQVLQKMDKNY